MQETKRATRTEWNLYATRFGFDQSDFGRVVKLGDYAYRIDGWLPENRKNKVAATEIPGFATVKLSAVTVLRACIDQRKSSPPQSN